MTGSEFRAIRRFNCLSQSAITAKTVYTSDSAVKEMERSGKVPSVFVKILSELIGLDFSNPDILKKELDGIPEKYFHAKISNRKTLLKPVVVFSSKGNIFLN